MLSYSFVLNTISDEIFAKTLHRGPLAKKPRGLRHPAAEPLSENHVAYVTRRASTEPRDSPADGGEREREKDRGREDPRYPRSAVGGETGGGVLVSRSRPSCRAQSETNCRAVRDGDVEERPDVLDEGFLMRFRARLPLRARGCAIATTEPRRPSRGFRERKGPVYPVKNLQLGGSCGGAERGGGSGGGGGDGGRGGGGRGSSEEQVAEKVLPRG
ncbi:hypothetical protein ALC56_00878 [Trachymyrmex septentrionalis]|uniref:Uncharacterized protein n=1 Tax=Trachymyrmex septentrionalis TaxID=34720 RepID=A0A195FX36_9HYME|nr:hypothetical protein ALC56_00878 [Trachymyrmex septentrionalis]